MTTEKKISAKTLLNLNEAAELTGVNSGRLATMRNQLLEAGASVEGGRRNLKWTIPISALVQLGFLSEQFEPIERTRARRRTKEEVLVSTIAGLDRDLAAAEERMATLRAARDEKAGALAATREKKVAVAEREVEKAKRLLAEYEPLLSSEGYAGA
ncbi:hypothetical protein [Frigoribacterium sp. 9N]|uniref:hypothetical protein n=1 Tax=Frigoribacterium sp. 9N TaxID=2653144 RepID=UPI0012EF7D06|nr:hypothetical protein [Frigoribacterium sp. 9N]VXB75426.1 conserved hypothetical protein [Frigoribacterium sp. 9N]